jgi:hypothetical protein
MTDSSFNQNWTYFLTHILPWVSLALGIILFLIMIYHCRRGGNVIGKNFVIIRKKIKIKHKHF